MNLADLKSKATELECKREAVVQAEEELKKAFFLGVPDLLAVMKTLPVWNVVTTVSGEYDYDPELEFSDAMTYEDALRVSQEKENSAIALAIGTMQSMAEKYKSQAVQEDSKEAFDSHFGKDKKGS